MPAVLRRFHDRKAMLEKSVERRSSAAKLLNDQPWLRDDHDDVEPRQELARILNYNRLADDPNFGRAFKMPTPPMPASQ